MRAIYICDVQDSQLPASQKLVRVWGVGSPATHPLGIILQYSLAQRAAQALYEVHGVKYLYGSISTTLCE